MNIIKLEVHILSLTAKQTGTDNYKYKFNTHENDGTGLLYYKLQGKVL